MQKRFLSTIWLSALVSIGVSGSADDCNSNGVSDEIDIAGGPIYLESASSFPVGTEPVWVSTADLDNDGSMEVLAANAGAGSISVLHGEAGGSFKPGATYAVGRTPTSILSADFNGDHSIDLLVTNLESANATVLLGNGDGTLRLAKNLPMLSAPIAGVAADFDQDGAVDSVIIGRDGVTYFLRGNGDGTFQEALSNPLGFLAFSCASGDFNGDGRPDLVIADSASDSIMVLVAIENGSFRTPFKLKTGEGPRFVLTFDVNDDGDVDVVAANERSHDVSVFLGNGAGLLIPKPRIAVGCDVYSLAAGDLDGDRIGDLAATCRSASTLQILHGEGDGTFRTGPFFFTQRWPNSVAIDDVNNDGDPDLLAAAGGSNSIWLLLGRGHGEFIGHRSFMSHSTIGVASADFNRDGALDLVAGNSGMEGLSIFLGNGKGSLGLAETYATGRPPSITPAVEALDLDGDINLDLVAAKPNSHEVLVLLGKVDGTFETEIAYPVGLAPSALAVGDFDGNSFLDLATANYSSSDVTVLLGKGTGEFLPAVAFPVEEHPLALASVDYDGDAELDIAVTSDGGHLSILWGTGDGAFGAQKLSLNEATRSIATADFDDDGDPDLTVSGGPVLLLENEGTRMFRSSGRYEVGPWLNSVTVANLNKDGFTDILSGDMGENSVWVLEGNGAGVFSVAGVFPGPYGYTMPFAGDFDGDGLDDVIVQSESGLALLMNRTQASVAFDCNSNGVPDECDIQSGAELDANRNSIPDACEIRLPFHRGDSNGDGNIDISDGLCILTFLFDSGESPTCREAGDANNDGMLDCSDSIVILGYIFLGTKAPELPGPPPLPCGVDPDALGTPEDLGCATYSYCT